MMDGRRHSVDIPISKTLLQLRRVRSLRDPSTNSMSKFSAWIDNVTWDTHSCNGISLRFDNEKCNGFSEAKNLSTCGEEEESGKNFSSKSSSKVDVGKNTSYIGNLGFNPDEVKNRREAGGKDMIGDRYWNNLVGDKSRLQLTSVSPSDYHLEGVDSNHESVLRSPYLSDKNHDAARPKFQYRGYGRSPGSAGDIASRVGSPFTYADDSVLEPSTRSASLFADDEDDRSYRGCGISCCFSRTPRSRDPLLSDGEDYPLLSGEVGDSEVSGKSCRPNNHEIVPYADSPKSLSQKFRPKSFDELVGQNVVARSLLGAISRGRIMPVYLFHGPRGTGKTSASRVFAAALNCLSLEGHKPCGVCQECMIFFSGRSRDVKEVDSVRVNHPRRLRSLLRNAMMPPVSSRFKVFIVDECQLLRGQTWTMVLTSLDSLSKHAVFVMVTPDLDKVPRNAVARCQRYHFPKIKEVDIASRLRKICVEEGLEFEQVALDFIATKCSGSLRDAEMMLDQLSLLGKTINMNLAYELIGTVSDDELLDLLDLTLSADTSNTVKRARELMRSRIDPMQLISQLANVIMDILAENGLRNNSEVRREFLKKHASETDLQKLRHALKILSESEKQLRTTCNQTTWLTVALLQLNSMDSSLPDGRELRLSVGTENFRDGDCCSASSPGGRSNCALACDFSDNSRSDKTKKVVDGNCKGTLESIWMNATEICESNSLKSFLRKRGKLTAVCVDEGVAVAALEFYHPDYVCKAEKSWKPIASALQSTLGRNVELRISLVPTPKAKKTSPFSFFGCSRRINRKSFHSLTESCSDHSDTSNFTSDKAVVGDKLMMDTCSSCNGSTRTSHHHNICSSRRKEVISTIRNSDGNALSTGTITPHRLSHASMVGDAAGLGINSSREEGGNAHNSCRVSVVKESSMEHQKNLPMNRSDQDELFLSPDSPSLVCLKVQRKDNVTKSPVRREASFDTYICTDYPYVICNGMNSDNHLSAHDDGSTDDSKTNCWKTPPFPIKKGLNAKNRRQRSNLIGWVLPCGAAK